MGEKERIGQDGNGKLVNERDENEGKNVEENKKRYLNKTNRTTLAPSRRKRE